MKYREPEYCIQCGKPLKVIHADMGKTFVGDTFIGYEKCMCEITGPPKEEGKTERMFTLMEMKNAFIGGRWRDEIDPRLYVYEDFGEFMKEEHSIDIKTHQP